ncbi:MAG: hypothetical protein AAB459_01460 [Patescibacteria group bacterium]
MDQSQPTQNDNSSTQPADPMAMPAAEPAIPVMPAAAPAGEAPVTMPPQEQEPSMGVQDAPMEENGASDPVAMPMAEAPVEPAAAPEMPADPNAAAPTGEDTVEDSAL